MIEWQTHVKQCNSSLQRDGGLLNIDAERQEITGMRNIPSISPFL